MIQVLFSFICVPPLSHFLIGFWYDAGRGHTLPRIYPPKATESPDLTIYSLMFPMSGAALIKNALTGNLRPTKETTVYCETSQFYEAHIPSLVS